MAHSRSCECGLTLVVRMDGDLVITGIPIKETEEEMVCKPLQHFINEGQREMILLCRLIEFPIIYAHSPPHRETLSDQLRSWREYPRTVRCFSRMVISLTDSSSESLSLMITGD